MPRAAPMICCPSTSSAGTKATSSSSQRSLPCRWLCRCTTGLQPPETATTVQVQDGTTLVTDGPFVETKEALGGYLILEADDLDAAIALAARIPAARLGGAIEVRPIEEW